MWALVRWVSRASRTTPPPLPPQTPSQQSALDILKARYVRGEIDTATYYAMREELEYLPEESAQRQKVPLPVER